MKKLLALFLIAGLVSGCVYYLPQDLPENQQEKVKDTLPAGQTSVDGGEQEAAEAQAPAEQNVAEQPQQQPQNAHQPSAPKQNSAQYIGAEAAEAIALNKAGLSRGEVRFDRTELDKERGTVVYEVSFEKGKTEYDAEINAVTGAIIDWEVDYDD